MIYSVLTAPDRYAYFDAPGGFPATGRYTAPRGRPIRGAFTVEQFMAPLPAGAVATGSGPDARGIVATTGSALGAWHESAVGKVGLQVVAGLVVIWVGRSIWKGA